MPVIESVIIANLLIFNTFNAEMLQVNVNIYMIWTYFFVSKQRNSGTSSWNLERLLLYLYALSVMTFKESDFYPISFIGNCSIVTLYELNIAQQPAQAVPASGGRGVANLQALLK